MKPGSVALRAAALGGLDVEGFGGNERAVTNGGALGSAGGVKAASKLSAVECKHVSYTGACIIQHAYVLLDVQASQSTGISRGRHAAFEDTEP